MKRNEAFPSKYMSKEDVDPPIIGTITSLTREKLKSDEGDETKTVMLFKEENLKPFILNNVNWMVCEDAYGEDSDTWLGKTIELYKDPNVMFGAKRVGGVRIRVPVKSNGNGHAPSLADLKARYFERANEAAQLGILAETIPDDATAEQITTLGKKLKAAIEKANEF